MEYEVRISRLLIGTCFGYVVSGGFEQSGFRIYQRQRESDKSGWSKEKIVAEIFPPKSGEDQIHLDIYDENESIERTINYPYPKQERLEIITRAFGRNLAKNLSGKFIDSN